MAGRNHRTGVVLAGLVAGVAAWCSLGVLAVLDATPGSPRVGLLPSWTWLVILSAFGSLATWAIDRWTALRDVRGWHLPLFFPALTALPWLPLPTPPAFLIWSGPLVIWIWVATAIGLLVAILGPSKPAWAKRVGLLCSGPRAPWIAALFAALIYGGAAIQLAALFPGGDEPHYLIITQSLLEDGDIRIENNHVREDYKAYFQATLRPDYLRRGLDGQIYSIHAPGISVLVAPAFAVGGYHAVVAFLIVVAALGMSLVWRSAHMVTQSAPAAWFGWAAVTLSAPVFFHAFAVYPEVTGATLIMTAVWALVSLEVSEDADRAPLSSPLGWPWWRWVLHGTALAILPWLHTRYVIAASMLGLLLGARLVIQRRGWRPLAWLLVVPTISAVAWFGFFKIIYGTFSPSAPYGHYTQTRLAHVPVALPALLVDQQFGLLPNAPVYALALIGVYALVRLRPRLAIDLVAFFVPYVIVVAAYRMWWGGWSAPARFLVPALPPLAIPAAAWWARQRAAGRTLGAILLGFGVLLTVTLSFADGGWLIFNSRDGYSRLFEWLNPLIDLPRGLPSYFQTLPGPALQKAGVWLGVMILGCLALRRPAGIESRTSGGRALLGLTGAAVTCSIGLSIVWVIGSVRPVTATSAQLAVLSRAASGTDIVAIRYRPLVVTTAGDLVRNLRITAPTRRPARPNVPEFTLPAIPAGQYRLDPKSVAGATGTLRVYIARGVSPVETWTLDPSAPGIERRLRIPCAANALVINAEESGRDAISRVALQPVRVSDGDACPLERARSGARFGSAIVLFFDDRAFVEETGFWVRGGRETSVVVSPDEPASAARLVVRNGAAENHVRMTAGAWSAAFPLQANEERVVDVPILRPGSAASVRIFSESGFRPSEVDRASDDTRYLGCWITMK